MTVRAPMVRAFSGPILFGLAFDRGAFEFLTFTQCRESKNPERRPIWNTYCFICGSTFLVGVNFEPLWVRFTDMYIL